VPSTFDLATMTFKSPQKPKSASRPKAASAKAASLKPASLKPASAKKKSAKASAAAKPAAVAEQAVEESDAPTPAVAQMTAWVVASGDNHELPFIVIDKVAARVFAYDSEGHSVGTAPALLGIASGDDSADGVGRKKLSAIDPHERTTPAGRFVAKFGRARGNDKVLWVDYPTSISLHSVITTNPKEHRLQRLNSPTVEDNRITFGCINVPAGFYKTIVRPLFHDTTGVVYILPETKPLNQVFLAFQPQPPARFYSDASR
jgi:hypothetical protein